MPRRNNPTLTARKTGIGLRVFMGSYFFVGGLAGAASLFVGTFATQLNNNNQASMFGVKITESSYPVSNGTTVHYRLCQSKDLNLELKNPAILFSPGIEIHWDRWTSWCIQSARDGYVVMMKDRPGTRPIDNRLEMEAGLEHLRSFPYVDDERVMLGGNSYGNREIQNYVIAFPEDIEGYFNISGFNDAEKMITPGSFAAHRAKTLVLSGGGEQPAGERNCDADGKEWTDAFVVKMMEDGRGDRIVAEKHFDMAAYGCVRHGFMWDYDAPATIEASRMIQTFVEYIIGWGPTIE